MGSSRYGNTKEDDTSSSWHSHNTNRSIKTQSTAVSDYSYRTHEQMAMREDGIPLDRVHSLGQRRYTTYEQMTSSDTYDSSSDDNDGDDGFEIDVEDDSCEALPALDSPDASDAIASTPRDFAEHFPSDNRIFIRHDDSTLDGNMNLRLDTLVPTRHGRKRPMTLFHLRMHDLKSRDFSLRRYCRDSGREVCRSERQYQDPPSIQHKPSIQRSLSYALASLRRQNSSGSSRSPTLSRADSGYSSMYSDEQDFEMFSPRRKRQPIATKTINLEFSNYAHVDVKRRGRGAKKCYTFEYWGINYSWKRHIKQDGDFTSVSFHLFKDGAKVPSAHIVPDALTRCQALEERERGGWIPQCSMWIKDQDIIHSLPDVAE
jgi:hypothetical protein